METDKIKIDLGFAVLVAEKGTEEGYNEMFIGLEDKDGNWIQDIAIVGQKYHYSDNMEVINERAINVKVYAEECCNAEYSHGFTLRFLPDLINKAKN